MRFLPQDDDVSTMPKRLPDPSWFIGKQLPEHGDYLISQPLGQGLNALVFVAHSDTLARDVACKIIPTDNLIGRDRNPPTWQSEITNANQVPSTRVVKIFALGTWSTPDGQCVYLLSDLVRGKSLREFCETTPVDVVFTVTLVEELLDFLRELQSSHHEHGDLHAGNILVEDRSDALTGPPYAFRITDFGVAPVKTGATLLDDYEQLAVLLKEMLDRIDYQALLPPDRLLFEFLRHDLLAKKLPEQDRSFDPGARNPQALFSALAEARRVSVQTATSTRRRLNTPFDYLSCEQIGEAHVLLKELYSDKMLGLPAVEDFNNLVLTGPRGCGKTTVYRCLSLKHRVRTDDDALESIKYIGIYYRCDDLYYSFPRYRLPSRPEGLDVPLHFLTVTLLREVLASLALWLPRIAASSWTRSETTASRELWELLEIRKPHHPSAHTFSALMGALEKERARAARKQRFVEDPNQQFGTYFGPGVLVRACALISSHFPEVADRPIFFLIDDYSTPKVSIDLQKNLNRLTMQRSASCFFKLATESPASYMSNDIDDKSYVEGREFRLVNVGIDFINASSGDKLRFVDDVFDRRLSYTDNFPVKTLDALVGHDRTADYNETARQIRDDKRPLVWGRNALAELCSGDVHFLIDLTGKMVIAAGGAEALTARNGTPAVAPETQNRAIRQEAGNFLKNLRALPRGPELVEIVEAFGSVAASYLRHRDSKNEGGNPPHQASRIEPYEDPHLTGDARDIYNELLRYSVFLEDVRGKSRRGLVVPRLYLRRFLIPFFNLTFSKRDSLELRVDELNELLLNPKQFESRKRMRGPDSDADPGPQLLLPLGEP
jgi:serine/threonine protein kinase